MDLFCFGDFDLVSVGVSRFIGVLGGLCDVFFAFLTLLGSLLDTMATITQPKFFLLIQFPPKMDENWLRYELLN